MIADLAFGLRLAVGGGRISGSVLLRLAMTTVGIALAVAVLLPAISIGTALTAREARDAASTPVTEPRAGIDPLLTYSSPVEFRGEYVSVDSLAATGPSSPLPPGLDRLPGAGELVVSPEVAKLLNSSEGAAMRARLPGTVIGVIGKPGLSDPDDLTVAAGTTAGQLAGEENVRRVYSFGTPPNGFAVSAAMLAFLLPVAVALLLPLLIFVTTASRMGAAQRDRRLAALRLIGVDARRIRRIAAAESLLGAFAGLLVGGGLFLALRPLLSRLDMFGIRVFGEDFVPPWFMAVLIVLLVPGLAVGAAIFGLRRTIVEPLGVIRQGKPSHRRMWWRWAIAGLGAVLMLSTLLGEKRTDDGPVMIALTAGSTLLLVGVAVLLPWAVERLVRSFRGGPPSWQFAVRRLQLDSGTASRVVSGLVVVLAGTILIQVLMGSVLAREGGKHATGSLTLAQVQVRMDKDYQAEVSRRIQAVDGAVRVHTIASSAVAAIGGSTNSSFNVQIGDCAALAVRAKVGSCADGDVFFVDQPPDRSGAFRAVPSGLVRFASVRFRGDYGRDRPWESPEWTVPDKVRHIPATDAAVRLDSTLLVTPAALGGSQPPDASVSFYVTGPGTAEELSDRVAAAVSPLAWRARVYDADPYGLRSNANQEVEAFRGALLVATLFVLMVAALSLLLLSVEQITERRRPLAALSAAGVPIGVLARGSLWQTAIPVVVGVVLAVAAGLGLTAPILRLADIPMVLDLGMIGGLAGAAVLAVLLVTAATLPLLRQVTKLDSLRAE